MGLNSIGGRRIAAAVPLLLTVLALAPLVATAQTDLEQAEGAREQAAGLVTEAVANRSEIEAELVATLDSYQDLSFELSEASADLARMSDLITSTDAALVSARLSVDLQGAEAYMQALSVPGGVVWSSDNIEDAMVAQRTLAILAGEEEDAILALAVIERDLVSLEAIRRAELDDVQSLAARVQSEADRLRELFNLADATVAAAIGEAMAADAAYRAALDEVERARVAEDESERQAERSTTTSAATAAVATTPTTAATSATATTGVAPASGTGGTSRPIKPASEQWRSLVAAYFSASMVDQALSIIQCESLGDPNAYNPYSGASGLFQFLPGTWAVTAVKAGFDGASAFDPEANIAAAAWLTSYYQALGRDPWSPWHCVP